jgi:CRP-like cAMP-binding protein
MLLKTSADIDMSQNSHTLKYDPFQMKIRQGGKINPADSIIWPWVFPKELKEQLNTHGELIQLESGCSLLLKQDSTQLVVIIQGAIKASNHIFKHKHSILDFYLPGDSFEYSDEKILDAHIKYEAIQNSFIYISPVDLGEYSSKKHSEFTHFLLNKRKQKTLEIQTHLSVLATFNAQEKVAFFLVNMFQRLAIKNNLHLPMSRVDISHYLSLTPETVSRELNRLDHLGYLKLRRQDIVFYDIDALKNLYS